MARGKKESSPSREAVFAFRGDVADATETTVRIRCGEAEFEFQAGQILDTDVDYEQGFKDVLFVIPHSLAEELNIAEAIEAESEPESRPELVKWLRAEKISAYLELTEEERRACGDRMAEALFEKAALESDLECYRKDINARIKSAERDANAASQLWHSGREERMVDCDVFGDYNTGEMVWTEKEYPHREVFRRAMVGNEKQLPLLDMAMPPKSTLNSCDSCLNNVDPGGSACESCDHSLSGWEPIPLVAAQERPAAETLQ